MNLKKTALMAGLSIVILGCTPKNDEEGTEGEVQEAERKVQKETFKKAFEKIYADSPQFAEELNEDVAWQEISSLKIFEKFSPYAPKQDSDLWWEVLLRSGIHGVTMALAQKEGMEEVIKEMKEGLDLRVEILKGRDSLFDILKLCQGNLDLKFFSPRWEELLKSRNLAELEEKEFFFLTLEVFEKVFFLFENRKSWGAYLSSITRLKVKQGNKICSRPLLKINFQKNPKQLPEEQQREIIDFWVKVIKALPFCVAYEFSSPKKDKDLEIFWEDILKKAKGADFGSFVKEEGVQPGSILFSNPSDFNF